MRCNWLALYVLSYCITTVLPVMQSEFPETNPLDQGSSNPRPCANWYTPKALIKSLRTRLNSVKRHERDWLFCVVITQEYDVTVNSEELIGTTEHLTLWARCRINRCRYNRVPVYCLIKKT
jgi:hypothetical protein